eukprot:SAG11_NODE_1191_length_5572_cov_1.714364_4_plen_75_part_00
MALQNKTQVLEAENTAVRAKLAWAQNRTQVLQVERRCIHTRGSTASTSGSSGWTQARGTAPMIATRRRISPQRR